jgi:hypothetical protein
VTTHERTVVVAALEAFEVGDRRLGADLLLDLLEGPSVQGHFCDGCGREFEWPGLLDDHRWRCTVLSEAA